VPDYNPEPDYVPEPYQLNDYGQAGLYCHFDVFKDKCLDYEEKICYSQAVERCHDVPYHKCTGTIETKVKRACFNVNELIKEKVDFDTIQEEYSLQLCTVVKDRVCDTTCDIEVNTHDDFQCCTKEQPTEEYGPKVTVCRPFPKKNCYRTPRTVSVRKMLNMIILICLSPQIRKEHCQPTTEHFCQKFTNSFPRPVETQNCHVEPKKVCEIQRRTRKRKAKRYS
jgi:hypothetical protein